MISKENAIKSFNEIKYFEENWYPEQIKIIEEFITRPTLDDAIKVVEEEIDNQEIGIIGKCFTKAQKDESYIKRDILLVILTALKGLKGE